MQPEDIPLSHIFTRDDARKLDEAAVRGLVESIREIGIINPLRVRPARRHVEGVEADAYEVTAGAHRLRAARKLGLDAVPCIVVDDDDLRAELAMIDENLMRAELSPADRAHGTARRKAIYLELHPETAHHVAGAHASNRAQGNASAEFAPAFTADTASKTSRSERAVQLDAERGEKVVPEVIELVRGTGLDTGTYLDKLKKLDPVEQSAIAKRDLQQLRDNARREPASLADRKRAKVDVDVRDRAAKEVAEILAEHVPADLWDGVKANLYAAKSAADIANHFMNLVGQSIMDRRHG